MASKKRRHIQNKDKGANVVVSAGKHSNRLHIRVSLTRAQEDRLRKMLEQRENFRRREK
jgi:hypothetical protein